MEIDKQDLLLREEYAKERTLLSLDRTLLSYIRTSLTATVVGITFYKLFDDSVFQLAGTILIIVAILLTVFGIIRTIQINKKISEYPLPPRR
jgi:putative membrane protein